VRPSPRLSAALPHLCHTPDPNLSRLAPHPSPLTSAGFLGVDVFLSNQWPRGFQQKLPDGSLPIDLLPDSDLPAVGAEAVAELACAPR